MNRRAFLRLGGISSAALLARVFRLRMGGSLGANDSGQILNAKPAWRFGWNIAADDFGYGWEIGADSSTGAGHVRGWEIAASPKPDPEPEPIGTPTVEPTKEPDKHYLPFIGKDTNFEGGN